jgi:hypothetical protein
VEPHQAGLRLGNRFSRDEKDPSVVTATGLIERIDVDSGATRVKICCSTIYGEVAFTRDEQALVNAGHWPRIRDVNSGGRIGVLTPSRESFTASVSILFKGVF